MKETQIENFENPTIGRIRGFIDEKGNPWFLAGQVCRCLGIKNSSDAISRIIEEHNRYQDHIKGVGISYPLLQTEGGKQKVCVISESILYELIFKSEKEKAFRFRKWVFEDVLPSLRKHGEYRMQAVHLPTLSKILVKTSVCTVTVILHIPYSSINHLGCRIK